RDHHRLPLPRRLCAAGPGGAAAVPARRAAADPRRRAGGDGPRRLGQLRLGEGAMSRIAALSDVREGQEVPPLDVVATRETLVRYAGASDDYAYQHWDRHRMIELGFEDVVVHGWLTFAYMTRAVTDWIPREVADIRSFARSEEHTSELQSREKLVCRLVLVKKND